MLITTENLCKSFGVDEILKDVNITINEKGRYGLIGVNGAGKSTLLKIIMGQLTFESGELVKKPGLSVGYLAQTESVESGSTIIEEMRKVFKDAFVAETRMRKLENEMAEISDHNGEEFLRISREYASAQAYYDSRDGYNIEVKIKTILNGMGFGERDMDTQTDVLSGGEKTRLAIARLLLKEPELLILDEPTNHLDFKTLRWLEDYLIAYNGAILTVSHDRYFLDKIVTHIYEVERKKVYSYAANYTKYLQLRAERKTREQKEYEAQQAEIEKLETYVEKNIARASTSQSAKSRLKALENMEVLERPEGDEKTMKLRFEHTAEPYKDVLTVKDLAVAVGERGEIRLCEHINLEVKRGESIAIIGENGVGKSSFLKTIQGIIPQSFGSVEWGKNVSVSYYEQENRNLGSDKLAIDELWDRFPDLTETKIRTVLGNVLLTKDDVFKPVKVISGGERAKLAFCIIMLEKSNVLILDEPTNHLDLVSKEILEKALCEYGGTLIFVSHDRYLLNKVPDKIVEITKNGAVIYNGGYDYYCEKQEELKNLQRIAEDEKKRSEAKPKAAGSGYRSKEQRRLEVQRKNRIKELEKLIEETENRIAELETEMSLEEVFSDYVLMNQKCEETKEKSAALEEYYNEWSELSEE